VSPLNSCLLQRRRVAFRWIGFSEDDGKMNRRRRNKSGGRAAFFCQRVEDNAFQL
jgi:hypothetical protein